MPSVPIELGKFVIARTRADGTSRVLFEVPKRLRPSGWRATIPLPLSAPRTGNLADAGEVARIQADAARLYEQLLGSRTGAPTPAPTRTMTSLIDSWKNTQGFKDKRPPTQKQYERLSGIILAWSAVAKHPDPAALGVKQVEAFLAGYDHQPTQRRHMKVVLGLLMEHAIDLEWRKENPVRRVSAKAPKTKVRIWEAEDVQRHAQAAIEAGQPGLAALILTEWEIGQRLTDVRLFRHEADYSGEEGVFRFWQSKTESYVTVPVSDTLKQTIAAARRPDSFFLFTDAGTGKPFTEYRLSQLFSDVRKLVPGRKFILRALRHSCVVQLARAGATVPQIAAVTGHTLSTAERILTVYLPRDNEVAWEAQALRGLVRRKTPPPPPQDLSGTGV